MEKFLRINFIGRPFELNKLTENKMILFSTKDEVNSVIKSNYIYYGGLYFYGIISCFSLHLFSNFINKSKYLNINQSSSLKKLFLYLIPVSPLFIYYFYVHVKSDYYLVVRNTILSVRDREKRLLKNKLGGTLDETKELTFLLSYSEEMREYIRDQTKVYKCIYGYIKYLLKII